jgi:hypothetical protein
MPRRCPSDGGSEFALRPAQRDHWAARLTVSCAGNGTLARALRIAHVSTDLQRTLAAITVMPLVRGIVATTGHPALTYPSPNSRTAVRHETVRHAVDGGAFA